MPEDFTEPTEPVVPDDELTQYVSPAPEEGTEGYTEGVSDADR